jgi:divalent metal cation (Fe/Co/Zn/Cd) transporter
MDAEAVLTQLGYVPNERLKKQLADIQANTPGYEKIEKHILDLNEHLKVNNAYVALSNSTNHLKIKVDSPTKELAEEAHEKIKHFSEKFKVEIEKLANQKTYYILGFQH